MTVAPRSLLLERAVQLTVAAAVVVFVLAAGSVLAWVGPARFLRWPILAVLAAVAVALAVGRRASGARTLVAAASALGALGLVSAAWSSRPLLTGAHAGVFVLLLGTCAALAWWAWGDVRRALSLADGVLLGVAAVAVGGLVLLAVNEDRAVQAATTELAARYQGLGGGPNTATMVLALGVPIATARALAEDWIVRIAAAALVLLLLGSIVASGSRGAIAAAFVGLATVGATVPRSLGRKGIALLGVGAATVVALFAMRIPEPLPPGSSSPYVPPYPGIFEADPKPGFVDANLAWRLQDDVGRPPIGVADTNRRQRTLLSSSGRGQAWEGTLELVADRPIAGYGLGLEDRVFVDRYVSFNSNVPENSYVGLLLQLGVVGALALLGVIGVAVAAGLRGARRLSGPPRALAAGLLGAVAGGLVLALFQSYLYAPGNNATLTFWLAAFVFPAVAATTRTGDGIP